ncbi:MAG TPA: phospholipase D-like domain-containing protein [Bacteroidia bacterium]|nr:phospholipase D-like domain-containing protein [Bacteroidia bacterium]
MKKTTTSFTLVTTIATFLFFVAAFAQTVNPKIKCYFNHPVNTSVSTGVNATYLIGSTSADTIAAYINRAKYTVDIAQYDYTSSTSSHVKIISTAINNAHARGVVIRWIYDGSSSNTGLSQVTWTTNVNKLASPVQSNYIMHNKFMIVDANSTNASDAILWTGSFDWSDEQMGSDYNNMVIIQDQAVAQAYLAQFNQMWGGTGATPVTANEKFSINKAISTTTSFTVNGTPVQVYFSPKDSPEARLINTINSANYEMAFGIYTFTDATVAGTIKTKYTGGIPCIGIMDQYSATYSPWSTLSATMGANLKEYTGSYIYHNKVMIVDQLHASSDPQVFTGSYNWTSAASNTNDENMIVIHDAAITNQYYQSLCKNFVDVGGTACAAVTGIESFDYGQQQYAFYPNPFKNVFNINVKSNGDVLKVKIFNIIGQVVKEAEAGQTDEMQIDLQGQPSGIYYVQITSADKIYTQKLIKE